MIEQFEISLPPFRRGFHLITAQVIKHLPPLPEKGLVNILIKHTSAALTLNENADPTVRTDFESFFNYTIPDDISWFEHRMEGADDMPAHLKSSLLGQSLTIPVTNYRLNLGCWQGIYLCEFRNHSSSRELVITILG